MSRVESGVPVSKVYWGEFKDEALIMKVGDSFFFSRDGTGAGIEEWAVVQRKASRLAQALRRMYGSDAAQTRKIKNPEEGYRVWRTK